MPYTPYHFAPSAFVGLALRKWIDLPVFVFANVIVDIEVLFTSGHPYFHTLLLGGALGACWGLFAYQFKGLSGRLMHVLCIPYTTSLWKMIISGILGVWFHVFTDAVYHSDNIRLFWPAKVRLPYWHITKGPAKAIFIAFFLAAIILYAMAVVSYVKQNKTDKIVEQ